MAFQTSVQENGEWVTRTVRVEEALDASKRKTQQPAVQLEPKPVCGLLSRTIAETPAIRQILPVRLRSRYHNDLAFISRDSVQINELTTDGHLIPVTRLFDTGFKIRNAIVIGNLPPAEAPVRQTSPDDAKIDDLGVSHDGRDKGPPLPPQLLALSLDSGDIAVCFLESGPDGAPRFNISAVQSLEGTQNLGFHMAVDPQSNYLVTASPTGMLVIYELHKLSTLEQQYKTEGIIDPIKSYWARSVQGTIYKLAFLYPSRGQEHVAQIIMFVIHKAEQHAVPTSRLVVIDWLVGENLQLALARSHFSCIIYGEARMPLLLVPIVGRPEFLIVCQKQAFVVSEVMSGQPKYRNIDLTSYGAKKPRHDGSGSLYWTAWARPYRRESYHDSSQTDNIYLAREDGLLLYLEIQSPDELDVAMVASHLDCNIDTAFAIADDAFSDLAVVGGESGGGGVWQVPSRQEALRLSMKPDWSPVVDVTAVNYDEPKCDATSHDEHKCNPAKRHKRHVSDAATPRPDSIFTIAGRGLNAALTELRMGMQVRVGIEVAMDGWVSKFWTFVNPDPLDEGMVTLVSLPHAVMVLRFKEDLSNVYAMEDTGFDASSRTVLAAQSSTGMVTQVTESTITLGTITTRSSHSLAQLLGETNVAVDVAFIREHNIIIATHDRNHSSKMHFLQCHQDSIFRVRTWVARGDVTSMVLFTMKGRLFIATGSTFECNTWISIYSLDGAESRGAAYLTVPGRGAESADNVPIDALTSLVVVHEGQSEVVLIGGTRCGRLVTVYASGDGPEEISWSSQRLGDGPVEVFPCDRPEDGVWIGLACCDAQMLMMTDFSHTKHQFRKISAVWATDDNRDPSAMFLPIDRVASIPSPGTGDGSRLPVMILSGKRLLFADVTPSIGPVPRSMPLDGTPTRAVYSHFWKCIIVSLIKGGRPTLAFIDPSSGEDISVASSKHNVDVDFVNGLGQEGDRIFGLYEWQFYKGEKLFDYILATTERGSLVLISALESSVETKEGSKRRIRYWTRHRKELEGPCYSITADHEGIIYGVGCSVFWDVLDPIEKRLKPMKRFELDSPPTSLLITDGKVLALTASHSLEVLDYRSDPESPEMRLQYVDEWSRPTMHMLQVGQVTETAKPKLMLVSDRSGLVSGVWIPWDSKMPSLQTVFHGQLSTPVRRFVKVLSLPAWRGEDATCRYGKWDDAGDGTQILGVSVGGALQHFTVLTKTLWRYLRLVENMARCSSQAYPLMSRHHKAKHGAQPSHGGDEATGSKRPMPAWIEPQLGPSEMHVDGGVLQRCVEVRALEALVAENNCYTLFRSCLRALDDGKWTRKFDSYTPCSGGGRGDSHGGHIAHDDDDDYDMGDDEITDESDEPDRGEENHGDGRNDEETRREYFDLGYEVLHYLLRSPI